MNDNTFCILYRHYESPHAEKFGLADGYVASLHHNGKLYRVYFRGIYSWSSDRIMECLKSEYHIENDFPIEMDGFTESRRVRIPR